MNDFADVKSRGFIEGYYGNPWSNEDRADLMTYGGVTNLMNMYMHLKMILNITDNGKLCI